MIASATNKKSNPLMRATDREADLTGQSGPQRNLKSSPADCYSGDCRHDRLETSVI